MIKVDDDYVIDLDGMNYIPKVKRTRINKVTKETYEDLETIGYYGTLKGAIRGLLDFKVRNLLMEGTKSLETALKCVQTAYKEFDELLERVMNYE